MEGAMGTGGMDRALVSLRLRDVFYTQSDLWAVRTIMR